MVLPGLQRYHSYVGSANIDQDWQLIDHLCAGWFSQDMDEGDPVIQLNKTYWAFGNELEVPLPAIAVSP